MFLEQNGSGGKEVRAGSKVAASWARGTPAGCRRDLDSTLRETKTSGNLGAAET